MTHTIYKYPLNASGPGRHAEYMPEEAKLLSIGEQGGQLVLWALVDLSAPLRMRHFELCWTGFPGPDPRSTYVGTCQVGPLVWHVFDVG